MSKWILDTFFCGRWYLFAHCFVTQVIAHNLDDAMPVWAAALSAFAMGLLWEGIQKIYEGQWHWPDILYNGVGVVLYMFTKFIMLIIIGVCP